MDDKNINSPIKISYRGNVALNEAHLYHRDLEKFLNKKISKPLPVYESDASLGFNEIFLTIILASIGKAVALTLLDYIEKKILEKDTTEKEVELCYQIIIKRNLSDTGKRFPFSIKKLKNNALISLFHKIREEVAKL